MQDSGGILLAEAAMRAFRAGAGDRVIAETARLTPTPAGLRIATATQEIIAAQAIVAAGPWIGDFVPALEPHLRVTRQTVGWFESAKPDLVAYGQFPGVPARWPAQLHLRFSGLRGPRGQGGQA